MELDELVRVFAMAIKAVDARCPAYITRTGRKYREGIGPYPENKAMELVVAELRTAANLACGQFIAYPTSVRQKCDMWLGDPLEWVVEVKMGRFRGDNGKPDDTGIKDLISPFRGDRSALSDGFKLAVSEFPSRKAVLVYGFDDRERPLEDAIEALDVLLRQRVVVGTRCQASIVRLRHPVFSSGRVVAWEIAELRDRPKPSGEPTSPNSASPR
jgi:hypothetical protein